MASVLATFAQLERRLIGERTKDALAAKKAAGVRLGRPVSISAAVTSHIVDMRAAGLTLRGIVDRLNGAELMDKWGGNSEDECFELMQQAADAGVDMISVTVGWQEALAAE